MAVRDANKKRPRVGLRALGLLAALLLGFIVLTSSSAPTPIPPPVGSAEVSGPRPPDPPASASAIALLGGLAVGESVAGWRVVSITQPIEGDEVGSVLVRLTREDKSFSVWVAPKGRLKHNPPLETAKYALLYGDFDKAADGDAKPVLDAFKERVTATEAKPGAPAL